MNGHGEGLAGAWDGQREVIMGVCSGRPAVDMMPVVTKDSLKCHSLTRLQQKL